MNLNTIYPSSTTNNHKTEKKEKKEEKNLTPKELGNVMVVVVVVGSCALAWVGLYWVLLDLYESCVSFASALLRPILLLLLLCSVVATSWFPCWYQVRIVFFKKKFQSFFNLCLK
jgi:hypothetical protein